MVKIKLKLRNNEDLTPEEDAAYLTYFSIMLRSRERINIINIQLE